MVLVVVQLAMGQFSPGSSAPSGDAFRIDYDNLIETARDADWVLTVIPMIGVFLPYCALLLKVEGNPDRRDAGKTVHAVAYGFRMLVDIAKRSLSDAFDPTTVVQAIDRLHDCLRQLARRPFPSGAYHDGNGTLRLLVSHITWEGYLRLAFDEIRQAGANSAKVTLRLRAALEDLLTVTPSARRAPLERQVANKKWTDAERGEGLVGDTQGIGSARAPRRVGAAVTGRQNMNRGED